MNIPPIIAQIMTFTPLDISSYGQNLDFHQHISCKICVQARTIFHIEVQIHPELSFSILERNKQVVSGLFCTQTNCTSGSGSYPEADAREKKSYF